jgi:hypothetical protein
MHSAGQHAAVTLCLAWRAETVRELKVNNTTLLKGCRAAQSSPRPSGSTRSRDAAVGDTTSDVGRSQESTTSCRVADGRHPPNGQPALETAALTEEFRKLILQGRQAMQLLDRHKNLLRELPTTAWVATPRCSGVNCGRCCSTRSGNQRFAELWASGAVGAHREDDKIVEHSAVGSIAVDCDVLTDGDAELKTVVLTDPCRGLAAPAVRTGMATGCAAARTGGGVPQPMSIITSARFPHANNHGATASC